MALVGTTNPGLLILDLLLIAAGAAIGGAAFFGVPWGKWLLRKEIKPLLEDVHAEIEQELKSASEPEEVQRLSELRLRLELEIKKAPAGKE